LTLVVRPDYRLVIARTFGEGATELIEAWRKILTFIDKYVVVKRFHHVGIKQGATSEVKGIVTTLCLCSPKGQRNAFSTLTRVGVDTL
jgi:hypothetical protein